MNLLRVVLFSVYLIVGCVAGAKEKASINCFWKAALHADKIGILNSQKRGKVLKLTGFLSGKAPNIKFNFPNWIVWQLRTPGNYLIPLTKKGDGYVITDRLRIGVFRIGVSGSGFRIGVVSGSGPDRVAGSVPDRGSRIGVRIGVSGSGSATRI